MPYSGAVRWRLLGWGSDSKDRTSTNYKLSDLAGKNWIARARGDHNRAPGA